MTLLNNDLVDRRRLVVDPSGTVVVLGIDDGRATLSKWSGSAWGLPIDVGPASGVYDVELLPGGGAFVALDVNQFNRGHVLHSPDAFGGTAFVDLGGFSQTLTHAVFGAWGAEPAIELLVDGTQVIALSHVQQLPNFGHETWTRRWTSTATLISDIRTEDDAVAVLPRSAVVVNGVISTLALVPANQTVAYLRSSDGFATKTTELWNMTTPDQTSLVVLADGRLAAVTCDRTSADIFQVHVRTSANGTSWSTPTAVRPAGGRGQRAYAAAATATGLLVVMGDNNALRAYRIGAAGFQWGNRPTEALAITLTP